LSGKWDAGQRTGRYTAPSLIELAFAASLQFVILRFLWGGVNQIDRSQKHVAWVCSYRHFVSESHTQIGTSVFSEIRCTRLRGFAIEFFKFKSNRERTSRIQGLHCRRRSSPITFGFSGSRRALFCQEISYADTRYFVLLRFKKFL